MSSRRRIKPKPLDKLLHYFVTGQSRFMSMSKSCFQLVLHPYPAKIIKFCSSKSKSSVSEAPGAVRVVIGNVSDSDSGYSVQWEVGLLGGGSITDAQIQVFEVSEDNWQVSWMRQTRSSYLQVITGIDFDEKKRINSTSLGLDLNLPGSGSFQIAGSSKLVVEFSLRLTCFHAHSTPFARIYLSNSIRFLFRFLNNANQCIGCFHWNCSV